MTAEDLDIHHIENDDQCSLLEDLVHKLDVTIENLPVSKDLFALLPEKFHELYDDFLPRGSLCATYQVRPSGQEPWRTRLLLEPQGMQATFVHFPYTVDRIKGTIENQSNGPGTECLRIDLTGQAEGQPVHVQGNVRGTSPHHTSDLTVWGTNIPLDGKLLTALMFADRKSGQLAQNMHPTGRGDFRVHARHVPDKLKYQNQYTITFHDASICYEPFPYRLDNVSGILEIRPDHTWEFHDFKGRNGDSGFRTRGHVEVRPDGEHVLVEIGGGNVRLDDELLAALKPELQRTWKTFQPCGLVDFDGTVEIPPDGPDGQKPEPQIELTVWPRGCTIVPTFFRYTLSDLRGKLHFLRGNIELEDISARHGENRISLDRGVILKNPSGGFQADLTQLPRLAIDGGLRTVGSLARGQRIAQPWAGSAASAGPGGLANALVYRGAPG